MMVIEHINWIPVVYSHLTACYHARIYTLTQRNTTQSYPSFKPAENTFKLAQIPRYIQSLSLIIIYKPLNYIDSLLPIDKNYLH